jgi:RNA polymerase sigma-70 factor, ECF subfamily
MPSSSEELLEQMGQGDARAVESLLLRHLPGLRAYIRLRLGKPIRDRESSCDVVQSVARDVLEHADRFQHGGESGFKRWLYKTAQRKIAKKATYWQAEKRDARRDDAEKNTIGDEDVLGCYRTFCTPSRHAIAREELHTVERAFDMLPEDYREVILLARVMGLSRAEIGEQLSRSEGAVRVLLSRALAQFTAVLADVD